MMNSRASAFGADFREATLFLIAASIANDRGDDEERDTIIEAYDKALERLDPADADALNLVFNKLIADRLTLDRLLVGLRN